MKKPLLLAVLAAVVWFGYQYGGELFNKQLPQRSSSGGGNSAERLGIVSPEFGQEASKTEVAKPAAAPAPAPAAAAPAAPAAENVFVCTRDVDAFDPAAPGRQLGIFHAGSRLEVGPFQPASGMFPVVYQDPGGQVVRALCHPADVGRKAPDTPMPTGSGFAAPSSSSPAPSSGGQGTVSTWKGRVEKAAGGH
jgi:hypothetical protein